MSENVAAEASSVDPLKTVADALETAVQAAKDGAADAKATVEKALPAASRFLSRFVYTTSYTFSYGIVFPAMLIAKSIPTNNAMVHGFIDGAGRDGNGRAVEESSTRVVARRPNSVASLLKSQNRDRSPWPTGVVAFSNRDSAKCVGWWLLELKGKTLAATVRVAR